MVLFGGGASGAYMSVIIVLHAQTFGTFKYQKRKSRKPFYCPICSLSKRFCFIYERAEHTREVEAPARDGLEPPPAPWARERPARGGRAAGAGRGGAGQSRCRRARRPPPARSRGRTYRSHARYHRAPSFYSVRSICITFFFSIVAFKVSCLLSLYRYARVYCTLHK